MKSTAQRIQTYSHTPMLLRRGVISIGGELLHVDMFAHNKSGIAYQDGNRRSETVVNTKGNPTSSQGCYQVVPIVHHLYTRNRN
jgi:hypothetical protein